MIIHTSNIRNAKNLDNHLHIHLTFTSPDFESNSLSRHTFLDLLGQSTHTYLDASVVEMDSTAEYVWNYYTSVILKRVFFLHNFVIGVIQHIEIRRFQTARSREASLIRNRCNRTTNYRLKQLQLSDEILIVEQSLNDANISLILLNSLHWLLSGFVNYRVSGCFTQTDVNDNISAGVSLEDNDDIDNVEYEENLSSPFSRHSSLDEVLIILNEDNSSSMNGNLTQDRSKPKNYN